MVKTLATLRKIYISNKCSSFEISTRQRILNKVHNHIKLFLNIDMFNTRYVSWAKKQYIRLISEGSCDSEDWSNDCWKFWFTNTKYLQFYSFTILLLLYFWPNKWSLKTLLSKALKNLTNSKPLNISVYSISIILVGKIIIWQISLFLFVISLLYWSCLAQLHTFSHELTKCDYWMSV